MTLGERTAAPALLGQHTAHTCIFSIWDFLFLEGQGAAISDFPVQAVPLLGFKQRSGFLGPASSLMAAQSSLEQLPWRPL